MMHFIRSECLQHYSSAVNKESVCNPALSATTTFLQKNNINFNLVDKNPGNNFFKQVSELNCEFLVLSDKIIVISFTNQTNKGSRLEMKFTVSQHK